MVKNTTITAIATPCGVGALAVIRISGDESFIVFDKCVKEKQKFSITSEREIRIFTIISDEEIIDEVTAIKYVAPKSYTGEDMVEIISHGGVYTVNEIIKTILKNGASIAQKGEFTRRAFNNGKIDILKAEAIKGIIDSKNVSENRNALNAYYGQSYKTLELWKNSIIQILSEVESEIEFDEEDVKKKGEYKEQVIFLNSEILSVIKKREHIKEITKGIKVVIVGPPNAGKSTLYNKILGYNRSIINEEPGTTRDLITERIEIHQKEITIIDSAGIRITDNIIEQEGIKRSFQEIEDAGLIIWITSADEEVTCQEKEIINKIRNRNVLFIINKNDRNNTIKEKYFNENELEYFKTSLMFDKNITALEQTIKSRIIVLTNNFDINTFVINERQENIIKQINDNIESCLKQWDEKEIVSFYLNEAIKEIETFSGKISKDEILNQIFDKFCIGK
jgi:tRNA modification GTPase